ncbi:inner-membrane translocator [Ferroglobus placidus DSM 10642]|uniref:Inner-membrane translocator n=1 Tax=Ferroglobus placidus (strain DSM 10642 / AEDII12DO) TaxID=589924 RepID=D3S106_FERPA|nr:branched-chain amino acid ABC transporter permease [Ferroglobus placidus]ADC64242.1 inner-membrane translocator [Ferroglobus placidus DSM 10642]
MRVLIYVALAILPFILKGYTSWLIGLALIYSTISISWAILENEGRISMGHSFVVGFSAYLSAITYLLFNSLIAGFLISIPLSATLFYFLKRTTGKTAFVFATFTLSLLSYVIAPYIVIEEKGGEEGFFIIHSFPTLLFSAFLFVASAIAFESFLKSKFGYFAKAIKSDELASRAVGIEVEKVKLTTSLISSAIGSFAGLCLALYFSHVSPEIFSLEISIFPFISYVVTGGRKEYIALTSIALFVVSNYLNALLTGAHLLLYAMLLILSPKIGGWVYAKGQERLKV